MQILHAHKKERHLSGTAKFSRIAIEIELLNFLAYMQEFVTITSADNEGLQNEKFDIMIEPLVNNFFVTAANETFSMSGFELVMARSLTPFLMNVYIPTYLLATASFIGFLIPVDMVPGRMALLVTIFLMLVNMSSSERNKGPVAS